MLTLIARSISSGFGSGYAPRAPGTFGSIAACVVWFCIARYAPLTSTTDQTLVALLLCWVGVMAAKLALTGEAQDDDPQWIVIDEWAGVFIALIGTSPSNPAQILAGLVLFRFFDILKPGPVRWAESLPGALGIMADDIVAGACALLGLGIYRWM